MLHFLLALTSSDANFASILTNISWDGIKWSYRVNGEQWQLLWPQKLVIMRRYRWLQVSCLMNSVIDPTAVRVDNDHKPEHSPHSTHTHTHTPPTPVPLCPQHNGLQLCDHSCCISRTPPPPPTPHPHPHTPTHIHTPSPNLLWEVKSKVIRCKQM